MYIISVWFEGLFWSTTGTQKQLSKNERTDFCFLKESTNRRNKQNIWWNVMIIDNVMNDVKNLKKITENHSFWIFHCSF